MDIIAQFISRNAIFFDSYGKYVLIVLFLALIALDWRIKKMIFQSKAFKEVTRTVLILITVAIGVLLYMSNFPMKPLVRSAAIVQRSIGAQIHDFDFLDVRNDSEHKISEFRGKVVLLNFWGTYCKPCLEEFPDLRRIETDFPDDVVVIALSDENEEKIRSFLLRIEGPGIVGKFASEKWINLETFRPLTVIIDLNGSVHQYMFGKKDYATFHSVVESLLQ